MKFTLLWWGTRGGGSANRRTNPSENNASLDYDSVTLSERKNYKDQGRLTFLTPLHQTLPNRIASLLRVDRV